MKPAHAHALESLLAIADATLKRLPEKDARGYVDGLTDVQLADVMAALSAADKAGGGTGDLFYESAAARLRGVDVATFGSAHEVHEES